MVRFMKSLRARFGRASRGEEGNSSIEFIILFPFYVMLVCSSLEAGLLMVRHVMLERAVDMSVRGLRLGHWTPPTHDELRSSICNNAGLIRNCNDVMLLELRAVSTTTWEPLASGANCVDRSQPIKPVTESTEFNGGVGDEMMLIRACVKFEPFFPMSGMGAMMNKDGNGEYALISSTAFVNEPTPGS